MSYNNNYNKQRNNNNGGKSFNKNNADRKPNKPVMRSLPMLVSGIDNYGNSYNTISLYDIMDDLQNAGVFSKLSVTVTMSKKLITGDDNAKGVMSVARVSSYDKDSSEIAITFFGKNTEYADMVKDMVIIPRVRTGRDTEDVSTILAFEIAKPE